MVSRRSLRTVLWRVRNFAFQAQADFLRKKKHNAVWATVSRKRSLGLRRLSLANHKVQAIFITRVENQHVSCYLSVLLSACPISMGLEIERREFGFKKTHAISLVFSSCLSPHRPMQSLALFLLFTTERWGEKVDGKRKTLQTMTRWVIHNC